ncbi:hypothetical protein, partial [Geobacillus sp. LEMMJ02]|uniref:hypothetical protein n=1 Tax=Geobacillus sp. LEMMJ02 TaxID=2595057 RepID=UPI00163DC648
YGFYFDLAGKKPKWACRVWDSSQKTLRLKSANSIPGWVTVLLTELAPYTESPFLRFFYAYQIIEYLMGRHLNDELSGFRDQMNKISDPTVVEVRDLLERLQGAMKEKVRIKAALQPICGATDGAAESMLDAASIDRADLNFA